MSEAELAFIVVMTYLGIGIVFGMISNAIAKSRGHTTAAFFWVGFFLPLIGIILAAVVAPPSQTHTPLPPSEWTRERDRVEADNARRRDIEGRLGKIGELHRDGLISDDELKRRRQEIIDDI